MSEYSYIGVPVGKSVKEMDVSPQFDAYTGVEIVKSEEDGKETVIRSDIFSPETGRIFRINNPWGTKEQANNILAGLAGGFQYQPYSAKGAEVNPAAEIGDGIYVNNVYSGIYKMSKKYTSLMASDVSAPQDEEVNHEFPYEPAQERVFKREIRDAQAKIKINADSISALVTRVDDDYTEFRSAIEQTAEQISATVKKVDGSGEGTEHFGWVLNSTSWSLVSGSTTVFSANKDGVTISGIFKAKAGGTIGGFDVGSSSIYKKKKSYNDKTSGVYIGTDGIGLGSGNFYVDSSGNVTANNLTADNAILTGTLRVGGSQITASNLYTGASHAASGFSGWDKTKKTVDDNKSTWNKAATNASKALEKAEEAMSDYNGLVSGNITASLIRATKWYFSARKNSLAASTITIDGTAYKIVTWS